METLFAATAILSPLGILIAVGVPILAILLARRPELSGGRLLAGYAGALIALALLIAATSYVSPQEASTVWKVPGTRYWGALAELFLSTFVVAGFATILGISIVGLPALLWLSRRGKATAPWLILTSLIISLIFSCPLAAAMLLSSNSTLLGILGIMLVPHAICAAGFALAARLPWRLRTTSKPSVANPPVI
jgi:hypothetical protein